MTYPFSRRGVLGLAATLAMSTTALAQQAEVTIGWVLPLSRRLGRRSASRAAPARRSRADQINAAGGIKSMGGAKLKLLFGDIQSKPDIGVVGDRALDHPRERRGRRAAPSTPP